MDGPLTALPVLALDCQAGGSTPAYGDLLEIGWGTCGESGVATAVYSRWVVPRTTRPVPWPVRELTGWSEACIAQAVDERVAWAELGDEVARLRAAIAGAPAKVPAVIHFARFELTFLNDLCRRIEGHADLPLDVVCVHAIAARLFPDLPRRNIRALAGYLGHSPELVRRTAGHVEATAFIWRALLPLLEHAGVRTWNELAAWLREPAPRARRTRTVYPLASERRRALPDRPGVYRFLRRSGDVLYVGKAASMRKRVAGHFRSGGPADERRLELLTQVHDISPTETATLVEAALLETDEIKRLDPPYNVQLRAGARQAWFATSDLRAAAPAPDDVHPIGPLPSERALQPLAALELLARGATPTPALCAAVLGVPPAFLPPPALFDEGFRAFAEEHDCAPAASARSLAEASRALWLLRGRAEPGADSDAAANPTEWDLARVRRRLERGLVQSGLLARRARFLCLLAESTVAFREPGMTTARALVISGGEIRDRRALDDVMAIAAWPARPAGTRRERQVYFDASVYDRLRVLLTEMHRVREEGGQAALRIGAHTFAPDRLARLMRAI